MFFLLSVALAGDQALYERGLQVLRNHYLWEERLDPGAMFQGVGQQLEERIEWLLVEDSPGSLLLRDGRNTWHAELFLQDGSKLPQVLAQLEDAVAGAGLPLDPEIDLRVEILKGLLRPLDRHTVVLSGTGLERFDERISGTLSGVGATIGPDTTGNFVVKGLFPNGPAMRGGVQVGDRLLRVDGVSTVGMTTAETTRRIRGEAKTEVVLTMMRGDQSVELRLIREELTIPNVSSRAGPQGVGVLKIDHFSEQTDRYLGEGLGSLAEQGLLAEGLVIDLRGNTGGSLVQSAKAADTFVSEGLIVRTAGRGGAPVSGLVGQIMAQPDRPGYAMPVVVLMDRATASGSEILAGGLRYLDRALLLGTPSFGKGTVQKTYTLAPELKLKLTVAEYLLDGDVRVADVGLAPDLALTEVHFSPDSIWYADPERLRARLPAGTPTLPLVVEEGVEPVDGTLEVAAGLLRAATGGTRNHLLDATLGQLLLLRAAADSTLEAAYQRHQIDWTGGDVPGNVKVEVEVSGADHLERGAPGTLYWKIRNQGDALHRAALRFRSVESTWEDRVLPLGLLAAAEQRSAGLRLNPEPGRSRRDPVEIWLEVEGRPAELLRTLTLGLDGEDPAELRVSARFLPCPLPCATRPELELTVENRGRSSLTGLVASLAFPEDPALELLEEETAPQDLLRRQTGVFRIGLRTALDRAPAPLELELTLKSKEGRRVIPLSIPLDGSPRSYSPPSLSLSRLPLVAPLGQLRLNVTAKDDVQVDHLVVWAGTETRDRSRSTPLVQYHGNKVTWEPGEHRQARVSLEVPVVAGANIYTITAEDDQGLRSSTTLHVLGQRVIRPMATSEVPSE